MTTRTWLASGGTWQSFSGTPWFGVSSAVATTGTTPHEGYSYPTLADAPSQTPARLATLTSQMDAHASGMDTDAARVKANKYVKLTMSAYTGAPVAFPLTWDTLTVNRGTPTDLSLFNGLLLGPGMWLIGAQCAYIPNGSGQLVSYGYQLTVAGLLVRGQGLANTVSIDGGSSSGLQNYPATGTGFVGMPAFSQYLQFTEPAFLTATQTQVACTINSGNFVGVRSAELWAFKVGD